MQRPCYRMTAFRVTASHRKWPLVGVPDVAKGTPFATRQKPPSVSYCRKISDIRDVRNLAFSRRSRFPVSPSSLDSFGKSQSGTGFGKTASLRLAGPYPGRAVSITVPNREGGIAPQRRVSMAAPATQIFCYDRSGCCLMRCGHHQTTSRPCRVASRSHSRAFKRA